MNESHPAQALIQDPVAILAVLLSVLAVLFVANRHPAYGKIFRIVPLIVFAYFVPTLLSNLGVIPIESPLYDFIKTWLLPASLVLLMISVDIPAILRLGPYALILFLTATASIVIGGPVAYLMLGWLAPESMGDQAWRGLAALSGSWIGGGANFVAVGESFDADQTTISMMVVVDVAVANVWMAILLWFAGRDRAMDEKMGADRSRIDEVRRKVEEFQARVGRPTSLPDLLLMTAIAFSATVASTWLGTHLASFVADHRPGWRMLDLIVSPFAGAFIWVVILVTTVGLGMSLTRLRNLEGAGASGVGSVLLYLLVASIGAQAEFHRVLDAPALVAIGAVWMLIHAISMLLVRRFLRAPIFFLAVGSQANVGGAASAPIVASAFSPALAPVGVLLSVGGYALGIYGGLACGILLQIVHAIVG